MENSEPNYEVKNLGKLYSLCRIFLMIITTLTLYCSVSSSARYSQVSKPNKDKPERFS